MTVMYIFLYNPKKLSNITEFKNKIINKNSENKILIYTWPSF